MQVKLHLQEFNTKLGFPTLQPNIFIVEVAVSIKHFVESYNFVGEQHKFSSDVNIHELILTNGNLLAC